MPGRWIAPVWVHWSALFMSVLITLPLWWQFRTFNLFVAAFVIPAVLLSVSALVPV